MCVVFLKTLITVVCLSSVSSFLIPLAPPPSNYNGRNLPCLLTICWGEILTPGVNKTYFMQADYCVIAIVTVLDNDLPVIETHRTAIISWNMYRNIDINQCNFSSTMDISCGNCDPYYYSTATSLQLCICSTNNCTTDYSTCQDSKGSFSKKPATNFNGNLSQTWEDSFEAWQESLRNVQEWN